MYCTTKDKRGREIYWRIGKDGKRTRTSKKVATKQGSVSACRSKSPRKSPKRKSSHDYMDLSDKTNKLHEYLLKLASIQESLEEHFPDFRPDFGMRFGSAAYSSSDLMSQLFQKVRLADMAAEDDPTLIRDFKKEVDSFEDKLQTRSRWLEQWSRNVTEVLDDIKIPPFPK